MSLETNATTPVQQRIVDAYIQASGGDPEFVDASITFDTTNRTVHVKDEDRDLTLKYNAAERWFNAGFEGDPNGEAVPAQGDGAQGDEFDGEPEPQAPPARKSAAKGTTAGTTTPTTLRAQPKPQGKGKRGRKVTTLEEHETQAAPAPAKRGPRTQTVEVGTTPESTVDAQAIEEARKALNEAVTDLFTDIQRERSGELTKNAARFAKGQRLDRFEDIGKALKDAGDPDFQRRGAVLTFARNRLHEFEADGHVVDSRNRLSPSEVSMTRKVWQAYLKHQGGLDATFRLVDAIDPLTGQPLVGDSGEPYTHRVTDVALNKLYALEPFYMDEFRDKIISFAHRNSEKAILAAKRLMDEKRGNIAEVIDTLNALRPDDGEEADPEALIRDHVAEAMGAQPPSQVKSIKVDRGWFDGDWTDLKRVGTSIAVKFGLQLDDRGQIPNTILLEHLISFFVIREHGADNLVEAFRANDTITEDQAKAFLSEYAGADKGQVGTGTPDDDEPGDGDAGDDVNGGDND